MDLYTLTNDNGVQVKITNYGGIITSILAPDRDGNLDEITLGLDSAGRLSGPSPVLWRIWWAATATESDAVNSRSTAWTISWPCRTARTICTAAWSASTRRCGRRSPPSVDGAVSLTLTYVSPDGEENYPGTLTTTVTYSLNNDNELGIDYLATTDKATVLNLTNHTYFNLAQSETILDHVMMINSDSFTIVDDEVIPTGEIASVEGTPLDFRTPTRIGDRIDSDDEQMQYAGGYDHNWIVIGEPGEMRLAARVTEPTTGRVLEVQTTQPAVQFYAGNMMPVEMAGRGGATYKRRGALCLETQHYPDSPNHPNFPSTVLRPGEKYHEITVYKFGAE